MDGTDKTAPHSPVKAKLKWFNRSKGFGFVIPDHDPDLDAFLHITALLNANCQEIGDNAELSCRIEQGPKGHIVTEIVEVISNGDPDTLAPLDGAGDGAGDGHDTHNTRTLEMNGEIKWYRPEKGFGFIIPEDGQKDAFLHKKCLEKHGLESVESGRKVRMTIREVPKGREVVSFDFLE